MAGNSKFQFKDSAYKFTSPIRTFKSNDPYAFFVDNIPLKQLAENTDWLRDQLNSIDNLINLGRDSLNELQPYVTGSDRTVRVCPGKFTARINDAKRDPHQFLIKVLGEQFGDTDRWFIPTLNSDGTFTDSLGNNLNTKVLGVLDNFKNSIATNANGLSERVFNYPVQDEDNALIFTDPTQPKVNPNQSKSYDRVPPFPLSQYISWTHEGGTDYDEFRNYAINVTEAGFTPLGRLEVEFIRRWRGIARTAIVNVPRELSISVPDFDEDDYFYTTVNNEKVKIENATTRIDLIFIYSKPIDQSTTTIGRFVGNQPTTISEPVLGIVKGAGIGVDYSLDDPTWANRNQPKSVQAGNTESQIIPNVGDESNESNGFSDLGIHGSFPSPDDLLNQAPLLLNELLETEPELIGQSILPVAYVVTMNTDSIIEKDRLVDIRPFFRTAELAYNERSGIAAAVPQLSLANPAVGKAQLDKEMHRSARFAENQITKFIADPPRPRGVATGYIQGGYFYGPEGVLAHYLYNEDVGDISADGGGTVAPGARADAWNVILNRSTTFPSNTPLSLYPQWDQPGWASIAGSDFDSSDWGTRAHDYLTPVYLNRNAGANYSSYNTKVQTGEDSSTYPDIFSPNSTNRLRFLSSNTDEDESSNGLAYTYVSKTIQIDKTDVPWMVDYDVQVDWWNCLPLTDRGGVYRGTTFAGAAGVWVEKKSDSFTIFCAWSSEDNWKEREKQFESNPRIGRDGDAGNSNFGGFVVMNSDMQNPANNAHGASDVEYTGEPRTGICIYPSITYRITGYPSQFKGRYYSGQSSIKLY
jgi:hypothetical protein